MAPVSQIFDDRVSEIEAYLALLSSIESELQNGVPKIGNVVVSAEQQRILYSCVYLQLYNLVEATISRCVDSVCEAIAQGGRWKPGDLSGQLKNEWVRHIACTHTELNHQNRLTEAVRMCDHLVAMLPVDDLEIAKGGGGNWDDVEIYRFLTTRLGIELNITAETQEAIKRPFQDDKGALALIVALRNDLAHGQISFGECGHGISVGVLIDLKERTVRYLSEVLQAFDNFLMTYQYLNPTSRAVALAEPVGAA